MSVVCAETKQNPAKLDSQTEPGSQLKFSLSFFSLIHWLRFGKALNSFVNVFRIRCLCRIRCCICNCMCVIKRSITYKFAEVELVFLIDSPISIVNFESYCMILVGFKFVFCIHLIVGSFRLKSNSKMRVHVMRHQSCFPF